MVVLSITALVLYYGSEDTQAVAKWLHLAFGFGCFLLFPAHALRTGARVSDARPAMGEEAA
jgi:hypothetical protein